MKIWVELPQPPQMQMKPKHRCDSNKYCYYHRDHDHDTEDYLQLRDEIERLIRQKRLNHFIWERVPPWRPPLGAQWWPPLPQQPFSLPQLQPAST